MTKYIVIYDSLIEDGDSFSQLTFQGFDSELDLVNWLIRYSHIFSIVAVSKFADFDEEVF